VGIILIPGEQHGDSEGRVQGKLVKNSGFHGSRNRLEKVMGGQPRRV
jgi:hypothetical protein